MGCPVERQIAVITGAAGFIGSHLVESLLKEGFTVRGVDAFTEYYDPGIKRQNLRAAMESDDFTLVEADVTDQQTMEEVLEGADLLVHLAAEAGVRSSWGTAFDRYVDRNVLGTQRVLEAATRVRKLSRIVVASSSSVYGDAETFPTPESARLRPRSPYGITKVATEHLTSAYTTNWDLPTVMLRFFTVFGPRQRPDMAFHRIIQAAFTGRPFPIYGDGEQVRDFTYIHDVIAAIRAVGTHDLPSGAIYNVAGGAAATLNQVIKEVEAQCGLSISVERNAPQPGDVVRTGADTTALRRATGWTHAVDLAQGIEDQIGWHRSVSS